MAKIGVRPIAVWGFLPNWGEGRNLNLSRFGMKFNSSSRLFKRRCAWGLGPVATRNTRENERHGGPWKGGTLVLFLFKAGKSIGLADFQHYFEGDSMYVPWPVVGTEYGCNLQAYFNLNNSWEFCKDVGGLVGARSVWCESWTVGPWICLICSSTSFFSSKVQRRLSHILSFWIWLLDAQRRVIVSMWSPGYLRGATTCRLKGKMKFGQITRNSDMLKDMCGSHSA